MLVPALLREQASRTPDRPALIVDGIAELTYGQWEAASNRLARALVARGLKPGDRVGLVYGNADAHRFAIAYMAVHKAGGVNVPLNTRLAEAEQRRIIVHSGMSVLLRGDERLDTTAYSDAPFQVTRSADDLADILYTSGTTGAPKGVACEHGNITWVGATGAGMLLEGGKFLHAVPVFTFAGAHAMMLIPLRHGMTSIVQPRFDPARFLALIEQHEVVMAFAVPSMVLLMLEQQPAPRASLRLLMYGTAPMPPTAIHRLAEVFPNAMLVNMYGLTEGGAVVCSLPPHEAQKRPTSVGKPVPPAEVRIAEDGEVWLRGPVRPRRYYRDDDATRATWTDDGWLRTGDIGYLDADGYLYLVDRKKDLIIRGGFNITAAEIEGVLLEHPRVRDAAVVGIPHPVLGEDTKAFVVGDAITAGELEAFCRERLADYKVPRTYELVAALPRNALGKVLKRELRGGAA